MIVKYMLLIYDDEQAWEKLAETERQRIVGEYMQFTQQIKSTGKYVTGAQLRQTLAATSVRIRDGRRVVTDGPFAETCEQSTTASLSPPILHVPTACPKLAEA